MYGKDTLLPGRRIDLSLTQCGSDNNARTQITLKPEMQRRARQRAGDLGVSLSEYVRRLLARDLGSSSRSDIQKTKRTMIAEAFATDRGKSIVNSRWQ